MRFELTPGNSLACKINTHRDGWRGTICSDPENWNCRARADFRSDFCATGDPRCFHIHTFDPADPHFVIERNGAEWLLGEASDALDDQILFLYGERAETERGIPERGGRWILFGVYRVREARRIDLGHRSLWHVRPHTGAWIDLSELHIPRPRYETIGGSYIQQFEAHDVARILSESQEHGALRDPAGVKRLAAFRSGYPTWIEQARKRALALRDRLTADDERDSLGARPGGKRAGDAAGGASARTLKNQPFRGLETILGESNVVVRERGPATTDFSPETRAATGENKGGTIEARSAEWIREIYGRDMLLELETAMTTSQLVILRGDPGVGKSHLALRLIDDESRERTLIVPVSATWRGREDLLGYVNPIDGRFTRTPFTQFLEATAVAWRKGDRRTRVVLFEEFNLSQPEHWLADILAVSQFQGDADRHIQLAGPGAKEAADVFLAPSIRFVATVNTDHTTRTLSPRVLDRAAIVPLELTAKAALRRIGLELSDNAVTTIADLDFLLRARGASFSIRSARALARCLEAGIVDSEVPAIDLVLVQQVLSKVHLAAHDSADAALLRDLMEWVRDRELKLVRCAAVLSGWKERLEAGYDVLQV